MGCVNRGASTRLTLSPLRAHRRRYFRDGEHDRSAWVVAGGRAAACFADAGPRVLEPVARTRPAVDAARRALLGRGLHGGRRGDSERDHRRLGQDATRDAAAVPGAGVRFDRRYLLDSRADDAGLHHARVLHERPAVGLDQHHRRRDVRRAERGRAAGACAARRATRRNGHLRLGAGLHRRLYAPQH